VIRHALRVGACIVACVAVTKSAAAQTVTVTVPAGVTFNVTDIGSPTRGAPSPTQVTYANAIGFTTSQRLNISVQPMAASFSGPAGGQISAAKVSWIASAASGTPSNGTLTFGSYTNVFRSANKVSSSPSGAVTLTWTLGALAGSTLRSGTYTLTVRWKFEAL